MYFNAIHQNKILAKISELQYLFELFSYSIANNDVAAYNMHLSELCLKFLLCTHNVYFGMK